MSENGPGHGTARNTTAPETEKDTEPEAATADAGPAGEDAEQAITPEGQRDREMSVAETGDEEATPAPAPAPQPVAPTEAPSGAALWWRRFPQVLALAVVWVLLWGSLAPTAIVGGLIIGLLVTMLFPLPLLPERLPFRPLKALRLLVYLAVDLAASGVRVSLVTLLRGRRAKAGIIGLPLCTDSDRAVTTIVAGCALTPGSYVLQIDRRRRRWYVYCLGLHPVGAVERVRGQLMNLQMRVIDAMGSDEDVRRCREAVVAVAEGRETGRGPQ